MELFTAAMINKFEPDWKLNRNNFLITFYHASTRCIIFIEILLIILVKNNITVFKIIQHIIRSKEKYINVGMVFNKQQCLNHS